MKALIKFGLACAVTGRNLLESDTALKKWTDV